MGAMEMALLAAACAGCIGAAALVDIDRGVERAPWAVALDPGD